MQQKSRDIIELSRRQKGKDYYVIRTVFFSFLTVGFHIFQEILSAPQKKNSKASLKKHLLVLELREVQSLLLALHLSIHALVVEGK